MLFEKTRTFQEICVFQGNSYFQEIYTFQKIRVFSENARRQADCGFFGRKEDLSCRRLRIKFRLCIARE